MLCDCASTFSPRFCWCLQQSRAVARGTYEYDARGNRTKRSSKDGTVVETYAYNDLARLISYQKERVNPSTLERIVETKAAYSYDPLGRRIQKDVDGDITQFAWLGQQLINESGSGPSKSYQYGPQGYAPLSVTEAGSVLSVVSDHLSAPVALLNGQTERWTQARTPFGVDTLSNDNYSFNIGLPGQYYDGESGLKQNYFRDYEPKTGRYIQRDPIGLFDGPSVYPYAHNNPIIKFDPTGEFVPILVGIGLGIIFDYAVEAYKRSKCGCDGSFPDASTAINAGVGAANGLFGPFARKPRVGASGGGKAGMATSTFSQMNHVANRKGYYSTATRHNLTKFGRSASRYVPYLSTLVAGYQLYDAVTCDQ